MDYYKIGQKIRKIRKAHGFSQEELAEKVNISTTHMSHIETGNTKLSLPVLYSLAQALQVACDDLLNDSDDRTEAVNAIMRVTKDCTIPQLKIIAALARSVRDNVPEITE